MVAQRRAVRLITRLNIGGPSRQALALTRNLRPDWNTVLAAGTPAPSEGLLSDPEVDVESVPLVRALAPRSDTQALLAVRRLLVRHRPALVHTHLAKAGTIGRIAAQTVRPRPRMVHTFHGHVLEGYFRPLAERSFLAVERQLAARTDRLVAVSAEVRDSLLDLGIGRPSQYEVIPLGFDLEECFAVRSHSGVIRTGLQLDDSVTLVGVFGRLVPVKNVDLVLRAMVDVPNSHIAIIGDGDQRAALERLAHQLGLAGRAHFTGWQTDVAGVMADLDVVALSSRNEGTPASLIEAGAAARAVVATAVGGVPTVVSDGVNGLLVPSGDAPAMAAALRQLIESPALRIEMGLIGRQMARRFTVDRLLADIRALYDELVPTS